MLYAKGALQDGAEQSAGTAPEEEARAWLDLKVRSHLAHGWEVHQVDSDSYLAHKDYPDRRKERLLFVRLIG